MSYQLKLLKKFPSPRSARSPNTKLDTLKHALSLPRPRGLSLEFGVHRGTTLNLIADSQPLTTVFGFDSFKGFPEDGREDWQKDFSLGDWRPVLRPNATLIEGFFEDTLREFLEKTNQKIAFLHVDCDIYSSTKTVFDETLRYLQNGTIIVFDELVNYKGFLANEMLALFEASRAGALNFEWVSTRRKVMPLEEFLRNYSELPVNMKGFRALGYEQAAALRVLM